MNDTNQASAHGSELSGILKRLSVHCSRSERCRYDIRILLRRWGIGEKDSEQLLQQLTENGFLNEKRYAGALVHDKVVLERWGRIKVAHLLRQKGIAEPDITDAFNALDMEWYRKMICDELMKKRRTLKGDAREMDARLIRFGASRGYEMEFIMPLVHHSDWTD